MLGGVFVVGELEVGNFCLFVFVSCFGGCVFFLFVVVECLVVWSCGCVFFCCCGFCGIFGFCGW